MPFSIEGRVLRELGERLVKHPEVAVVELIKNAYDADAKSCTIRYQRGNAIVVQDNGHGMTLDRFSQGWMRIGTSAKEATALSPKFRRPVTGEKGIGRFAVRFLGRHLQLDSVADDPSRGLRTQLRALFDWPEFDLQEDLGKVTVPYQLYEASPETPTGTSLQMTNLRPEATGLNFNTICTGAISILTPLQSLFHKPPPAPASEDDEDTDPGFSLRVPTGEQSDDDIASRILSAFVLRATIEIVDNQFDLKVYRRGGDEPYLRIVDSYDNSINPLYADIRFFPARKGTFTNMPVDGRRGPHLGLRKPGRRRLRPWDSGSPPTAIPPTTGSTCRPMSPAASATPGPPSRRSTSPWNRLCGWPSRKTGCSACHSQPSLSVSLRFKGGECSTSRRTWTKA